MRWPATLILFRSVLSGVAIAACDSERQFLSQRFGSHVSIEPAAKPCSVRADFNGDGTVDAAILVRLSSAPAAMPATITRVNPWSRTGAFNGKKGGIAIAVSLEGPAPKLFLLVDGEFFSSPMWQSPDQLLSKVEKAKGPRGAKGDSLGVATESGIDLRMYWTGTAWRLDTPQEEP
jgi:hypothetical protein